MFWRKCIGLTLVFFVWMCTLSTPFQQYASLPEEMRFFPGEQKQLSLTIPVHAQVSVHNPDIVKVNGNHSKAFQVDLQEPISLQSENAGWTEMQLKLFGKIPLKKIKVNVVPDLRLIPGGQTIGVKLKSKGILVVGHHLVAAENGEKVSPSEKADIQAGDLITHMDGIEVREVKQVPDIVKKAGEAKRSIKVTLTRKGKTLHKEITPAYDKTDQTYRLGIYIRDSAAGVGTLTFYSPDHGKFGALGHVISDTDTGTPIEVLEGEIVHSNVTSINKGQNGIPGEKRAHFFHHGKILGNIEKNTAFGIFGNMHEHPEHGLINEPMQVAFSEEVKVGPAQIMTVVEGQKVEKFDIEITHVSQQKYPETKGMVIKITDKELLKKTGGIVQGMSGSPIIQDDKIVGAVTHVFVNDPASGYGCFIEWMLQDAGIMLKSEPQSGKAA